MIAAGLSALAIALLWGSRRETIRQLKDDDLPIGAVGLGILAVMAAFVAGYSV